MPLHDWTDDRGFDSLHLVWQNQLLEWVQPRLPPEYRAYMGGVPSLSFDAPNGRPDLGVRNWNPGPDAAEPQTALATMQPDIETAATFELDPMRAVHIDLHGVLIAAIEIISPRNKDRPSARARYLGRYLGYLRQAVHLMVIDVLPRPTGFSFADEVGRDLGQPLPPTPTPFAVSYRVGGPTPDGTLVATWRRPLAVGQPLPTLPLPLNFRQEVPIDLEHTYREAARRVYLT